MRSRNIQQVFILLTALLIVILGGGTALAQGKGHGGGDKHGGGDRHGGGGDKHGKRGGDRGDRGNGRQKGGDDQRAFEQQQRQQNDQARQQQRQQQQNERIVRQQQQQQNDLARQQRQQQQNVWEAQRRQQQYQQQVWRQQQQADRYQYDDRRSDRGKHKGWNNDGPRGNAFGLRNIWPGEFRGWRDPDKQARKANKRNQRLSGYYYTDPIISYYPAYQQPIYGYNSYNGYTTRPTRENIVRSIISSFFASEPANYNNNYYGAPVYQRYTPVYYGYQQTYYGGNNKPFYSQASYSPIYRSPSYNQGYDPYLNSPMYGTQLFGGNGLKSSLLNIGLGLLQGFLGQGYQQGRDQGQYVRQQTYVIQSNRYYDPYAAPDPVFYSPLASSFSDQRQLLAEGYRLGYQDAMLNRDPYGTGLGGNNRVDMISEFLANTLIVRI